MLPYETHRLSRNWHFYYRIRNCYRTDTKIINIMPCPSHRAYKPMNIYTDKLPRLWFLRPWHHVRQLHKALMAVASYSKTQDTLINTYIKHEDDLRRDRDRAIILANKYRYKYESRFDYFNEVLKSEDKSNYNTDERY